MQTVICGGKQSGAKRNTFVNPSSTCVNKTKPSDSIMLDSLWNAFDALLGSVVDL